MCHAYAAGSVLRAFHERHPEQANAAALEIWRDLEAGDGLSEWAYEWLQNAGVDPDAAVAAVDEAALVDRAAGMGGAIRTAATGEYPDDDAEPDETAETEPTA